VENNEEERTPYSMSKAVLQDEKWDRAKAEFKTRENSASPNVISAQRSTLSEVSNEVATRLIRSVE